MYVGPDHPARGATARAVDDYRRRRVSSDIAEYRGTGKRKTSVARVILRPGDGAITVNGKTLEEHFPRATLQAMALAPLELAGMRDRFEVWARLHGGGVAGQAGALRHGIARALVEADPALRTTLKREGVPDA